MAKHYANWSVQLKSFDRHVRSGIGIVCSFCLQRQLSTEKLHPAATAARFSRVPDAVLDDCRVTIIFDGPQPDPAASCARHRPLPRLCVLSGPPLELPELPARQYGLCHPFGVPDVSGKQKTPCVIERTTPPFGSTIAPVQACE